MYYYRAAQWNPDASLKYALGVAQPKTCTTLGCEMVQYKAQTWVTRLDFIEQHCKVYTFLAHSNFSLPGLKHISAASNFRPALLLIVCTVTLNLAKQNFGCNKFSAKYEQAENKYAPNICWLSVGDMHTNHLCKLGITLPRHVSMVSNDTGLSCSLRLSLKPWIHLQWAISATSTTDHCTASFGKKPGLHHALQLVQISVCYISVEMTRKINWDNAWSGELSTWLL